MLQAVSAFWFKAGIWLGFGARTWQARASALQTVCFGQHKAASMCFFTSRPSTCAGLLPKVQTLGSTSCLAQKKWQASWGCLGFSYVGTCSFAGPPARLSPAPLHPHYPWRPIQLPDCRLSALPKTTEKSFPQPLKGSRRFASVSSFLQRTPAQGAFRLPISASLSLKLVSLLPRSTLAGSFQDCHAPASKALLLATPLLGACRLTTSLIPDASCGIYRAIANRAMATTLVPTCSLATHIWSSRVNRLHLELSPALRSS